MNLDRLTELRKRKIGLFNIRLTVSASPKARTPGMNQDTGVRHSRRWARLPICLTRRATIYWGALKKAEPFTQTIELTNAARGTLTVDGQPLNQDEIIELIAFVRTKRRCRRSSAKIRLLRLDSAVRPSAPSGRAARCALYE